MKYVCGKCGHSEDVTTKKMKCDCGGSGGIFKIPGCR